MCVWGGAIVEVLVSSVSARVWSRGGGASTGRGKSSSWGSGWVWMGCDWVQVSEYVAVQGFTMYAIFEIWVRLKSG